MAGSPWAAGSPIWPTASSSPSPRSGRKPRSKDWYELMRRPSKRLEAGRGGMEELPPQIIVLAGPNGAGKSTAAAYLLPEGIPFINADEVAKTLPGYPSKSVDIKAGRLDLERMDEFAEGRMDHPDRIEDPILWKAVQERVNHG